MKSKNLFILLGSILFMWGLSACSSGSDDDINTIPTPTPDEELETSIDIQGYWLVTNPQNKKNTKYQFISFNSQNQFAFFLGDDIFGSGEYTINGDKVNCVSGFNGKEYNLTIKKINQTNYKINLNGYVFNALKQNKTPIELNSKLVGATSESKLGSKDVQTIFSNEYSGIKYLISSTVQKYTQTFEYIYTDNLLLMKRYQEGRVPSIGGWNGDLEFVKIYDTEFRNGFFFYYPVQDYEE